MPEFREYRSIKKRIDIELGNWIFYNEYRAAVEKF